MRRLLAAFLLAFALRAQTPIPEAKDPLGRNSPQETAFRFLEACHSRDYRKALLYLDLRHMSAAEREKDGEDLARQLEDLLDDTPFAITTLSRDPEGDQGDGLPPDLDLLDSFKVDGQTLDLQLERVQLAPGAHAWLVSAASIPLIPRAHQLVAESGFERRLPQQLVTFEIFDTPVWRWIALVLSALVLWALAGLFTWAMTAALKPLVNAAAFRGPLRIALAVGAFRAAMELMSPATVARVYVEHGLGLIFSLAVAWGAAAAVDVLTLRWHSRLDPRVQAVSYSVLPLGRQVLKLSLYLIAILSVLGAWGYNTSAILAGLGVGGLAVALAAQKTIENLFGGVSIIGDRPVLVGDNCRFGDRSGTIMHIGLRSTRIRTADRTIVSVPNGQFAAMPLENLSARDKIWFHRTINLRRDTKPDQLLKVLASFGEILKQSPKVETGKIPVRFIGPGAYSLDVEVIAYVKTTDDDEFLALQHELLIKMLQAVESAGTGLAVPLQENFAPNAAATDQPRP